MKRYVVVVTLLFLALSVCAQTVRIAQIDTGRLLTHGTVDAYVAIDHSGSPRSTVNADAWDAWEIASGHDGDGMDRQLEIVEVVPGAASDAGIDFLLLVDNSGSMYEQAPDGRTRMDHVREAIEDFLAGMEGSSDRVALATFNTYITPLAQLGASPAELVRSLDRVEEPDTASSYTELYQAMSQELSTFLADATSRKAVIVLSDGEDYPFSLHSGISHPIWGNERLTRTEVTARFAEEEATAYAISFADSPDADLAQISRETGGIVFEAYDSRGLAEIYGTIRESIRGEVRVRIHVPSGSEPERLLRVSFREGSDETPYLVPLLLGEPSGIALWIPIVLVVAALLAIVALHFVSLERVASRPEIQPVGAGRTVALQNEVTVIGASPEADVSLAGTAGVDQRHATVVHDPAKGSYTLVSERPVRVNNTLVTKRALKPGDVIAIEDVTLVFDAPAD